MPIINHSIHRTSGVISGFELCSAVIIAFLAGWITAGSFGIVADVYQCQFAIGWDEMINFDKWRVE